MSQAYNPIFPNSIDYRQLRATLKKNNYWFNFTMFSNYCMTLYFFLIGSLIIYAFNKVINNHNYTTEELQLQTFFAVVTLSYIIIILGFAIVTIKVRNLDNTARSANIILLFLAIFHQIQLLLILGTDIMQFFLIVFVSGMIIQVLQLYTLTLHSKTKSIFENYASIISSPMSIFTEFPDDQNHVLSPYQLSALGAWQF